MTVDKTGGPADLVSRLRAGEAHSTTHGNSLTQAADRIDRDADRIEALERALRYARTELAALIPNPERVSVADWPVSNPADAVCLNLAFAEITAALSGATPPADGLVEAHRDVLAERKRQIESEGWTTEHDDAHRDFDLEAAAACYAFASCTWPFGSVREVAENAVNTLWPWGLKWWKPTNRRRNLVKAGALILAAIERLDRTAHRGDKGVKDV